MTNDPCPSTCNPALIQEMRDDIREIKKLLCGSTEYSQPGIAHRVVACETHIGDIRNNMQEARVSVRVLVWVAGAAGSVLGALATAWTYFGGKH